MGCLCWQVFEGDRANPEGIFQPGPRPIVRRYNPKFHPAVYRLRGKINSQPLGLSPLGFGISSNHVGGSHVNKYTVICSEAWL